MRIFFAEPRQIHGDGRRPDGSDREDPADLRRRGLEKLIGKQREIGDGRPIQNAETEEGQPEEPHGGGMQDDRPALPAVAFPVHARMGTLKRNAQGQKAHGQRTERHPERPRPVHFAEDAAKGRIKRRAEALPYP